jgi:hypothetical protein
VNNNIIYDEFVVYFFNSIDPTLESKYAQDPSWTALPYFMSEMPSQSGVSLTLRSRARYDTVLDASLDDKE